MYGACEGQKRYNPDIEEGRRKKKVLGKDIQAMFPEESSLKDDEFKKRELKEIVTFLGIGFAC